MRQRRAPCAEWRGRWRAGVGLRRQYSHALSASFAPRYCTVAKSVKALCSLRGRQPYLRQRSVTSGNTAQRPRPQAFRSAEQSRAVQLSARSAQLSSAHRARRTRLCAVACTAEYCYRQATAAVDCRAQLQAVAVADLLLQHECDRHAVAAAETRVRLGRGDRKGPDADGETSRALKQHRRTREVHGERVLRRRASVALRCQR